MRVFFNFAGVSCADGAGENLISQCQHPGIHISEVCAMTTTTPPRSGTVSAREAARLLGIDKGAVYRGVEQGQIRGLTITGSLGHRRVYIAMAEVDRILGGRDRLSVEELDETKRLILRGQIAVLDEQIADLQNRREALAADLASTTTTNRRGGTRSTSLGLRG